MKYRKPLATRLSPKAYPLDWPRLGITIAAGVLLVLVIYVKVTA